MSDEIKQTLAERGKRYGDFLGHAILTQNIKQTFYQTVGYERLLSDQREALDMIAHKISRILNGDPNYRDSWVDIAGYAMLVAERLSDDN